MCCFAALPQIKRIRKKINTCFVEVPGLALIALQLITFKKVPMYYKLNINVIHICELVHK